MRTWLIAGVLGAAVIGAAAGFGSMMYLGNEPAQEGGGVSVPNLGGPFSLVDHTGAERTEADFAGTPILIYFGYSYCPDICPTELAKMVRAVDLMGDDGDAVQPLFISVDPERDTPEHLAGYVELFHPRLIGLTGDEESVADVAHAYKVYYAKVESEEFDDYLMDHSSYFYLMDGQGKNLAIYPMSSTAEEIADGVRQHLSNIGAIS